ncbi:MAG: hypothetical protein AB1483_10230 [Candidatus Zixiibacteriota bacterium]
MNISIKPNRLGGIWHLGWTLDRHTISSRRHDNGTFTTKRTELGEALYRLKYCGDRKPLLPIARTVAAFIRDDVELSDQISAIVPIPPSDTSRRFQPVLAIANETGKILGLDSPSDYLVKVKKTSPLKDIEDRHSRSTQLAGAFTVRDLRFEGRCILLLDDLYRSGETLAWATKVILAKGRVSRVFVLALTKTRIKR